METIESRVFEFEECLASAFSRFPRLLVNYLDFSEMFMDFLGFASIFQDLLGITCIF